MIYIVSYDIQSDKLRVKVAKKLMEWGLERIQYSVFLGSMTAYTKKELEEALSTFCAHPSTTDRIIMIPLTKQQLKKYRFWGAGNLDLPYICDELLVLIL